jgi:hypothetical protein
VLPQKCDRFGIEVSTFLTSGQLTKIENKPPPKVEILFSNKNIFQNIQKVKNLNPC